MERRRLNPLWVVIIVMPLVSVVAALLVLVATSDTNSSNFDQPSPTLIPIRHALEGQVAPGFELARLNSDETMRLSSLRGRVVFVNFWATWCAPCRRELPTLQAFAEAHSGRDAPVILAVNIGETPEKINDYLTEVGVELPLVLLDSDFSVSDAYKANLYPSTFVIDAAGRVTDVHLGRDHAGRPQSLCGRVVVIHCPP